MRRLFPCVIGLAVVTVACEAPPSAGRVQRTTSSSSVASSSGLGQLAWMAGTWVNDQDGRISEEHWTAPAGGTMFGINRTIVDNETVGFEYLRIEVTPQGIIYYASPEGRYPPTPFRLTRLSGQLVIFANAGHDFPVRIMYRREGDALFAGIEGEEDGEMKSSEWSWHLVRP